MKKMILSMLFAALTPAFCDVPAECTPAPRGAWWPNYFKAMMQREPRDTDLVFLGDSITMMWRSQSGFEGGTAVWNKYYKPLNACNYGVSGDKTENILWRLSEGKNMDGFNPRVCVLLIGINNLLQGSTPQNTAAGITAIVRELRKNHPDMKILLLGVFPCRPKPEDPIRQKVKDTNAAIAGLHDGKHIFYADIGSVFLEKDGTVSKEILRDYLHLSEKGYERWAEAMRPHLDPLLKK